MNCDGVEPKLVFTLATELTFDWFINLLESEEEEGIRERGSDPGHSLLVLNEDICGELHPGRPNLGTNQNCWLHFKIRATLKHG